MLADGPPHLREPKVTLQDVHALVARAQQLADSRPATGYTAAWCVEAACLGDLSALAAVAGIAARSTAVAAQALPG